MNLIEAKHISKQFVVQRDWLGRLKKTLTAVDDLSLTIGQGETVGLVGESGCGKSTFARTLLGLYAKTGGSIAYKGRDIADRGVGRDYRRHVQMIFQDPYASLDPRMTVEDIISEPLRNYHLCQDDSQRRQRVASLLEQVDMRPKRPSAIPMNSAAASASASALPGPWPSTRNVSSAMNLFRPSTCPSRSRSST